MKMELKVKSYLVGLLENRILQHILFWSLSFLILLNVLKVSAEIKQIDVVYTVVFHIPFFLIVYLNLQVLFPFFLEKERYFLYGTFVILSLALGAGFYIILFNNWIDYIFTGYYFIAYYSFWDISLFFIVYIATSSLLHLARGWFRLQEIEQQKTLAELKSLKSQINPHFLFNSLNSIYSLSRKKSPLVSEKIVQLSDLMRHILYNSDSDFTELEKEIEMIKNYIELQNLRTPETEKITFAVNGEVSNKKIAPLIFLPFVENSFKHGLKSGAEQAYVKINLEITDSQLMFYVENLKGRSQPFKDKGYNGIGIENVRKRLELIYPGTYSLEIREDDNIYKVYLMIQMK